MNREELNIKHQRVVEYLEGHQLDAVGLSRRCNFSWYTCGAHNHVATACDAGCSLLLVEKDRARVLTNNIEATRLRGEELAGTGIDVVEFPYSDAAAQSKAFADAVGSMRIAADAPADQLELSSLGGDFDRLRWALTPQEIDKYRSLCADTVAATEAAARSAEPGQSENEMAGMLAAQLQRRNCLPWVVLVAGDDRVEKFRHPLPTDNVVDRYFMLVTCAERHGLIVSTTRIASFEPISDELAEKTRAAATVDTALISSTRVGSTLGELFAIAQEAYAAVGFPDQWQLHHQGGPCGYLPRDLVATPGGKTKILANQAFAWNPSITGTKCEDTILCAPDGPEFLAEPTDWPMIEAQWKGHSLKRPDILIR